MRYYLIRNQTNSKDETCCNLRAWVVLPQKTGRSWGVWFFSSTGNGTRMYRYPEKTTAFSILVACGVVLMLAATVTSCLLAYDPCDPAYSNGSYCIDGGVNLPGDDVNVHDNEDTGIVDNDTGSHSDAGDGGSDADTGGARVCTPPCEGSEMCIDGQCVLREPGIIITPEAAYLEVGESIALLVAATLADYPIKPQVTWHSADESVATVGHNGMVTAMGLGLTTITATTLGGAESDTCDVQVHPRYTIAEARNRDDESSIYQRYHNPVEPLIVQLNDTVEMQGVTSTVPEGTISTYRWQTCAQPEGSSSVIITAVSPPSRVTFQVDALGDYCFELEVYNNMGAQNPDKDQVWVRGI